MVRKLYLLSLSLCICCLGCREEKYVTEINDEDATEVWFEDIASNVRVVPLISEEPIGSIKDIIGYDDEMIAIDNNNEIVYYFVDGVLVSKMNHKGRGHGEYLDLSRYTYSPVSKIFYVLCDNKAIGYSLPAMNFCGNITFTNAPKYISMHDENTFFVATIDDGKAITELMDIQSGEITKKIEEINLYSLEESNISMTSYSIHNHYYAKSGHDNSIVALNHKNEAKCLFSYNFGDKSIPEKYVDYDISHIDVIFDFLGYMMENGDTRLQGNQFVRLQDDELSFWYYYSTHTWDKFYYKYNLKEGKGSSYKGFRIKGINRPIYPLATVDDGYVSIFEGNASMYKSDEEPSDLAKLIFEQMNIQKENNPVLLFYNL